MRASIAFVLAVTATGCGKQDDKPPPAAAGSAVGVPAGSAVGSAATAVDRKLAQATDVVGGAGKAPLTPETYEKLILGLEGCTLKGYQIDRTCPGVVAMQDAMRGSSSALQDLAGLNATLGKKLIGHTSPAVRVKSAELMGGLTGTQTASEDAIVVAAGTEQDPAVLRAFVRVVANAGAKNPNVAGMLIKAADHPVTDVRLEAVYAIASSWNTAMKGGPEKLASLVEKDADAKVRQAACEYGGKLGHAAMMPAIDKATQPGATKAGDELALHGACMGGLVAMFYDYPHFQTKHEPAYRLFLKRIGAQPRGAKTLPFTVAGRFETFGNDTKTPQNHGKLTEWKQAATFFKAADVRKALTAVALDKTVDWMARSAAVRSIAGLGASRAELETLKKGLDANDQHDKLILPKLDEAIAAAS